MASTDKAEGGIVDTIKQVFYALLIAGIFRAFFFQPFWIPSGSMKDTLLIGDFLFVNKMAYGYSQYSCEIPLVNVSFCPFVKGRVLSSEPEVGDVVVFKHPTSKVDYIKRLIGKPGDKIQMIDGVLHINGTALKTEPDGFFEEISRAQGPQRSPVRCFDNIPVGDGAICQKEKFIETLPNGVEHSILNIVNQPSDNTQVFTVPAQHYFFMGDNRDNSTDSRFSQLGGGVGYAHEDLLIGRADRVMFSSAGKSLFYFWTWRGDRFFKKIE
ncbi:signal peptidase [Actibacterium mucosum KCTC 23349]|uniref:Signal peptidase I n=1 Tax=Actibacterium mucosum KCTC 23349 TaxID=1454373 RepID=A0A037ZQ33_9RHOB|nr:signal peptidase I [Actibacterium mucosum]KAJ56927.1 signal peptidase [Actibacterium mucosum KCTC 23349]